MSQDEKKKCQCDCCCCNSECCSEFAGLLRQLADVIEKNCS